MSKSVSQFLLGIDLSSVELNDNDCSAAFGNMTRIQWLKLVSTGIDHIPKGIENLTQLQRLTVSKNNIEQLSGEWYANLKSLRSFIARKNKITDKSLPNTLFHNLHLQVVDLSFNLLTEVPIGLFEAKSLLVLNLSDNKIKIIPKELFANCCSLIILDLSNNEIIGFPTNLRRMPNLQSLNLCNNPLTLSQLRSINGLKKLTTLLLSNTSRRLENIPSDLDKLPCLRDLDISENNLPKVPQTIYEINSLTKLNLSGNDIDELNGLVDCWPNLEVLNLSRNRLTSLPSFITRLSKLKKLYIDNNQLNFNGIPPGIGKLSLLEVFSASENNLENIPEGLCRCGQLKHLNLRMNKLVALPDAMNVLIESLVTFNIENNPNLKMPTKLDESTSKSKRAFYNIDFSLETQMQLARGAPVKSLAQNTPKKDTASRIRRLRRKKFEEKNEKNSSKRVLEGMQKVAKEKDAVLEEREREDKLLSAKRWQDAIAKPNLDYSRLFEDDVGIIPGVEIWEIDEFYPRRVSEELVCGTFYNGDCYIILHTCVDEKSHNVLYWYIYYWIGKRATLDKVTCAAVHSVNLRNFLGADCRCERIEQDDESDEFKALFDGNITVFEGAHGETGFMKVEDKQHRRKLYRLFGADKSISIYALNPSPEFLDSKFVYLYDASPFTLYLWIGIKSRLMLQTKGRLLADNINQCERKGLGEIIIERENEESVEFKASFEDPENNINYDWSSLSKDNVAIDWKPSQPILYDVKLGKGYLEMPQVEIVNNRLVKSLLEMKHVYILDSNGDMFVWMGDLSPKFLKFAGLKLAYELLELLPRSSRRSPVVCYQSAEPQNFKMQFCDWAETCAVDFTRSVESVRKRGIDMDEIMERDKMKIDMRAFFMPREKSMPWDEAKGIMDDCNEDLVESDDVITNSNPFRIKQFVYQNKKLVLVENKWVGHFFSQDCYIVRAEYWELPEEEDGDVDEEDSEETSRIQTVIYFWQGREVSDIPWLQFNFSIKKEMEMKLSGSNDAAISKDSLRKVETKRMFQQQEISTFLAHFRHRFVIHLGRYQDRYSEQRKNSVQFYCLRENGSALCTRTIEVAPMISFLNSCFHYILKIPACMAKTAQDQVICWIGKNADSNYDEILETIALDTFKDGEASIITVKEGEEPDIFWQVLRGNQQYEHEAEFMKYTRLFRLSNEQGFFCASEKCSDFCQDDLADEDAMLLDTGDQIYLWFGNRTSDVEKKLSLKAAKLYQEHMARIQPDRTRQLKITYKKKEPHNFRRCFHGWGTFKEAKDWSG